MIDLLVRTPRPLPSESLLGYVLRLAECNGFATPRQLLTHAGISEYEFTLPTASVKPLARVLGRDAKELAHIAYHFDGPEGRRFKILDHPLGPPVKKRHPFRLRKPALCPECVSTQGFIDAFFDLRPAVACPTHRRLLVQVCPACLKTLRWHRPSLLTCHCGSTLADARGAPANDACATLMAVLAAKLHRKPLAQISNDVGFPLADLEALPLWPFLQVLHALGFHALGGRGSNPHMTAIVEASAQALSNWPRGFYAMLYVIGNRDRARRPLEYPFVQRFFQFNDALFRERALRGHLLFMHDEFIRFGEEHWSCYESPSTFRNRRKRRWPELAAATTQS